MERGRSERSVTGGGQRRTLTSARGMGGGSTRGPRGLRGAMPRQGTQSGCCYARLGKCSVCLKSHLKIIK